MPEAFSPRSLPASRYRRSAGFSGDGSLLSREARERNDLHRGVPYLVQESVDGRPAPQDLPAGARGLSEDDVGDPFAVGELDETIGHPVGFHPNHRRSQSLGELDVLSQRVPVLRPDAPDTLFRSFHVDRVPAGAEPSRDPGAGSDDAVIFNAIVIIFLIPLALRGVRFRPLGENVA